MFQNNQMIFVVVAIVASIFGLYYLHKNNNISIIGKSGIILIISGAIGNLIDRVRLGFVVDYFDFRYYMGICIQCSRCICSYRYYTFMYIYINN